jgi:hypothetical protein
MSWLFDMFVTYSLATFKRKIHFFQKRNFTQSTKYSSLNLALTAPAAQANIFGQNPADRQHCPVDNINN